MPSIWDSQQGPVPRDSGSKRRCGLRFGAGLAVDGGAFAAESVFDVGGEVAVVDVATGDVIGRPVVGHKQTIDTVSYSPDGALFVTGGRDGRVGLWDGRTGSLLASVLPGRANIAAYAEFMADGRNVLVATRDGAVYEWDTSPEHWIDVACRVARRNLTEDEWRESFGDRTYRETCPGA